MSEKFQTKQEAFDYIVSNLIKQGGPSLMVFPTQDGSGEKLSCAYRGQGGRRCAGGWLIPDEAYKPGMEGLDVGRVIQANNIPMLKKFNGIASDLQDAHDSSWAPNRSDADWLKEFMRRAKNIAREHDLRWNHG